MKLNKIFLFMITLFMSLVAVQAVDLNNISFTNQEFYAGAVTATKTIELSNGKLAVGYVNSNNLYAKICDLDGTNCGTEYLINNNVQNFDMFEDTDNNQIVFASGRTTNGEYQGKNLNLTTSTMFRAFNTGATNYVSAVQTSSTDFAVAFQDTADSSNAKTIICKLDGSSCGTENTVQSGTNTYLKLLKTSDGLYKLAGASTNGYVLKLTSSLTSDAYNQINLGTTSFIDMIEGSDNKLKIVYRDVANSSKGTFISCNLDGTSCGSEIVFSTATGVGSAHHSLTEFNSLLFVTSQRSDNGEGSTYNFNLAGGDISTRSVFDDKYNYGSMIINSNNQLVVSYNEYGTSKGMFAVSENLQPNPIVTINSPTNGQYLNSTTFTLDVENDWAFTGSILDSPTLTDFDTVTNLTDNAGFIELFRNGFDVSTAVYDSVFSVSAQEISPQGLTFNTDGTKMFVIGSTGDDVNEYHCTTGFDVSTCSYDSVFYVGTQETTPTGLAFSTDGTKMFVIGVTGVDVNEYHCTTGFDVSTCSYDSVFYVGTQDVSPQDLTFNTDGTKMFVIGNTGDDVNEYHCTTGFDVSTCSYDSVFYVGTQETTPAGLAFNTDGTKMFVIGFIGDDVNEYHCTTGFDVSTCSYDSVFYVGTQDTTPIGLAFSTDGTKMFVMGETNDAVREYHLAGDYYTSGYASKQYTLTDDLDTFTVEDTRTLNGQTITSKLYYNGTEYTLTSGNPYSLNVSATESVELRYYFTGTTSATPQLSNITFTGDNLGLTPQVEMFYSLNGAANVSLGNVTSSVSNITGVEGVNTLIVYATDSSGTGNSSISFTIDTINPVITNNLPTEINEYFLDFLSSTCTDTNIDTCTLTIQSTNYDLLTESNATLTYNGNSSYTITAVDLAGNSATTNGVLLVNPYAYFYFEFNGTPISNYVFNGETFTGTEAKFKLYNDGISLGENNFTFEKLGYATTDIIFDVNTTSNINLTSNITQSTIVVRILDRETGALITQNVTVTLIATQGYSNTFTGGEINISDINFLSEDYQLIAESLNYATETVYFTYDNQEILEVDVYLLSLDTVDYGYINVKLVSDNGLLINNGICQALEWIPSLSNFQSRSQGLTSTNGLTSLNIEIGTKSYKFRCNKNGFYTENSASIISSSGQTLTLILKTSTPAPTPQFENFVYNLYNTTYNTTHQRIFFDWNDLNGLSTEGCLRIYKIQGVNDILLQESCGSSSNNQVQLLVNINNTYNIKAVGYITSQGVETKVDTLTFLGNNSFGSQLSKYRLDVFLPILFIVIGIVLGFILSPNNIYMSVIGVFVMTWVSYIVVPTIISLSITIIISIICIMLLYGGNKQ